MSQLKIGNIKLKNPLILAPMLDVTTLPFRILCRSAGASLAYTEMIYTSQILNENIKTIQMMKTTKEDNPLGIQVTGSSLKEFRKIIPSLEDYTLIDLNCGCPSIRLIDNKAGSYLLNHPNKISGIIKVLKQANIPISVKIRLGFKKNNALKIAKTIEKAGADALTIHPRLAVHSYSTPADWSEIKKIKHHIGIPIVGNGDISSPEKASEMLEIADAAMIGRAAIGNPLIFKQTLDYLKTGKYEQITVKQKIRQLKLYLKLSEKYNQTNVSRIKFVSSNFLKGFGGASKQRQELMSLKTFEEIKEFTKNFN